MYEILYPERISQSSPRIKANIYNQPYQNTQNNVVQMVPISKEELDSKGLLLNNQLEPDSQKPLIVNVISPNIYQINNNLVNQGNQHPNTVPPPQVVIVSNNIINSAQPLNTVITTNNPNMAMQQPLPAFVGEIKENQMGNSI